MADPTALDPTTLDVAALGEAYRRGTTDPVATTEAYLARIAAENPRLNVYLTVTAELARAQATASAARYRAGTPKGPLDGVPLALKDNIDVAGVRTTNGFAFGRVATEDAVAAAKLRAAGAVFLGKATMHEGALGATTDNPHWGRTHNPCRQGYTPGGSSGGSAAAVAAHLAAAALGSDTMASIRLPAAYCGCVGLKATYGRVSTRGVAALSWRLDHVGPITRTVEDARLLLAAIDGYDAENPDAVPPPARFPAVPARPRLARIAELDAAVTSREIAEVHAAAMAKLERLTGPVANLSLPGLDLRRGRLAAFLVSEAEASIANATLLADNPGAASSAFRSMIDYGAKTSGARLVQAERTVGAIGHAVRRLFEQADILVTPAAPQTAFTFDGPSPTDQADLLYPFNCSGSPAISVPCGRTADGLPVGLQLVAPAWAEESLLAFAARVEAALS